jgi:CDP-diacylglycerol---glycerol-3-phosphate 3-phosphatidyltransferase
MARRLGNSRSRSFTLAFIMWLAHGLTLVRIPIAIAIAYAYGNTWPVVGLIVAAAASDAADGNVARYMQRRGHTKPAIGGWLDPLADKIFVAIVLAAIVIHTHDLALIALIGARELLLLPLLAIYLAVRRDRTELKADPIGKLATIAQFIALALAVALPAHALPGAIVAAVLGVASVVHYVRARRMQPRESCNTSSNA